MSELSYPTKTLRWLVSLSLFYGFSSRVGADNTPYEKVGKNAPVSIADEVPFEIPESWEWVRLGSIVYNRGQRTPDVTFCYIDIGSIDNENQQLNTNETILSPEEAPSRARKIVGFGDILYSTVRPYLHNMCIINRDFSHTPIASTGFAAMTCHTGIFNQYLFYYLMSPSFDSYANDAENSKGVAYPAINDARLYHALIPIPPENEQTRIVERLVALQPFVGKYKKAEETLGELNTDFPEKLKKSILQLAVQGKLVPQDPSDEPASVLLERIRAEKERLISEGKIKPDKNESVIYRRDNSHYEKLGKNEVCIDSEIPFELPDSWAWTRLGNLVNLLSGQDFEPSRYNSTGRGVPYITGASNIEDGNVIINRWTEYPKNIAHSGELLVVCKGAGVGKMAILNEKEVHIARQIMSILPITTNILYLQVVLEYNLEHLRRGMQGVIPGISRSDVLSLLCPVPPLAEQGRIVKQIEMILPMVKSL